MKRLFLKWCVINVVSLLLLFVIVYNSWQLITSLAFIGKTALAVIASIYIIANIYAARICYRESGKVEAIGFAAHECPFIGLLGAVAGIVVSLSDTIGRVNGASNFGLACSAAMSGIGIAFLPTFFGIYCRIVLWWIYNLIISYEA